MNKLFKYFLIILVGTISMSSKALAGRLDLGLEYQGWSSNYQLSYSGWEILVPFSLSYEVAKGIKLYGVTEYASGHYTDQFISGQETALNNLSDTVLGADIHFNSFSLPALLNVAVNLPTGEPSWEAKQQNGGLPPQFVDSRYRGRGFGVNAVYGLSFPTGNGEIGATAGYMYSAAFNPNYDLMPFTGPLKLSDSLFLAFNHYLPFKSGEFQVIRLSGYYSMATQENGVDSFQMGPNLNASYSWNDPAAFSFELGGQYYFSSKRPETAGGPLVTESQVYYAPRLYLAPSYSFGQFNLGGMVKYILANGYGINDSLYNGGGLLLSLRPGLNLPLDGISSLRISGSFGEIIAHNEGWDASFNRADAYYYRWTLGTNYEIKI